MASLPTLWRTRGLNLDHCIRTYRFELHSIDIDRRLPRRELWLLIRLLFTQTLTHRACANHFIEEPNGDFRMSYCFSERGDTWYEMVSPPGIIGRQMIDTLRKRAGLNRGRTEGRIHYLLNDRQETALCVSRGPQELCVYFSSHRPRPLDKEKGDLPGCPTSDSKEVPADLPQPPRREKSNENRETPV